MSESIEQLGGRLPLLTPDKLNDAQRKLYDFVDSTLVPLAKEVGFEAKVSSGALIGPFNPFLFAPEISQAYQELLNIEWKHTKIERRVREVIILTVGYVWNSAYEMYAHTAVARHIGFSEDAIASLRRGEASEDLSPAEQTAQRFVKQLCTTYAVDDELYQEAERVFGVEGVVNMIQLAGIYVITAATLNAFKIPVPQGGQR
jgi:4-carboxymuconolactone decarboxylase